MSNNLIYSQISRKKGRFIGLALIVAVLSLVMFSGFIIIFSLNSGLESLSDRMGADLMVVPLGYESGAEGILIKGEPSYFYFDKSVLEEIVAARMSRAKTLLAGTTLSIAEIAAQCGYRYSTNFRNAFRAATGLNPLAWRKNNVKNA